MPDKMFTTAIQAGIQLSDAQPGPYYVQLQRQLQALIDSGTLGEGSYLPSERDLAEALNVSRTTVKRAYDALREADVIASSAGRGGTMVKRAPRVSPEMSRLKGFTEEMRELGKFASTTLLVCEVVHDRRMASIFQRPSNALFLHIERVREADGVPMTRELAWYDLTLAPIMAEWDGGGSAYERLKQLCGVTLGGAEQTVEAVLSSDAESAAFGFEQPQPCLLFKRMTRDVGGALVEYVEGTFRGDAYVYRMQLNP